MNRRHKARRWVLQILYAWEMREREGTILEEAGRFFDRRQIASPTRSFAGELLEAIEENLDKIDATLADCAENWDVSRMSIIDRNILRIALAEFSYIDDVPSKVTINEGVELAARYGGQDSPRFVNGVLDAVAHRLHLIPS